MDISTNSPCQLLKKFIGDVVELCILILSVKGYKPFQDHFQLKNHTVTI